MYMSMYARGAFHTLLERGQNPLEYARPTRAEREERQVAKTDLPHLRRPTSLPPL